VRPQQRPSYHDEGVTLRGSDGDDDYAICSRWQPPVCHLPVSAPTRPDTAPFVASYQELENKMMPTCYGGDKLFDEGIRFPRGDAGPQLFGRPYPKLHGDVWNKSARSRTAAELGTSQKSSVRAWKTPGCEHICYQTKRPQ